MDDIINYVMNTPSNTNPNVLKGLLDKMGGSGYTVEETRTVIIPEQTAEFISDEDINGFIVPVPLLSTYPDTFTLHINEETYNLSLDDHFSYGEANYSNNGGYPIAAFGTSQGVYGVLILVNGTYSNSTISAESITKSMTVSPEFQEAVAKSTEPLVVPMTFTNPSSPITGGTYDSTYYDKMLDAFTEGRQIMLDVPTMGQLQVINMGSSSGGSAVFNCMTMAYLSSVYLLIVINLTKEGRVFVNPFTLTQPD